MTLREEIAAGPVFQGETPNAPMPGPAFFCPTCADFGEFFDKTTGLCRPCWRAWRFGPSFARYWYQHVDGEYTPSIAGAALGLKRTP